MTSNPRRENMSLVEQVEKAIEEAVAVCKAEDGVCHATHVGGSTVRLMAEHGPAILAAVELAQAYDQRKQFHGYGVADWSKGEQDKGVQSIRARERLEANLTHALAAYRAAIKGAE